MLKTYIATHVAVACLSGCITSAELRTGSATDIGGTPYNFNAYTIGLRLNHKVNSKWSTYGELSHLRHAANNHRSSSTSELSTEIGVVRHLGFIDLGIFGGLGYAPRSDRVPNFGDSNFLSSIGGSVGSRWDIGSTYYIRPEYRLWHRCDPFDSNDSGRNLHEASISIGRRF